MSSALALSPFCIHSRFIFCSLLTVSSRQPQTWPPELRLMISEAALLPIGVLMQWVKQHRPAVVHFHGLGQSAETVRNVAGMIRKLQKVGYILLTMRVGGVCIVTSARHVQRRWDLCSVAAVISRYGFS